MSLRPAFLPHATFLPRSTLITRSPAATSPFLRHVSPRSSLSDRVAALPRAPGTDVIELLSPHAQPRSPTERNMSVANRPGKAASFRIFAHVASTHSGVFNAAAAADALKIYGDVVDEARAEPGRHPSIDWLLDVAGADDVYVVKIDGEYIA